MISVTRATTVSFDVDPQRCFTPLCPDELPVEEGHLIADELNAQAELGIFRLVSKDCHPAEAPWIADKVEDIMTPVQGDYPGLDIQWPAHCVEGSEGNLLIPGLPQEDEYDLVIEKGQDPLDHPYGACYHDLAEQRSTGAIEWLREHNISTVLVGGLATDYCVKNTVLQLLGAGFQVIVNLEACRGVAKETSSAALQEMVTAGALLVTNARELVAI